MREVWRSLSDNAETGVNVPLTESFAVNFAVKAVS